MTVAPDSDSVTTLKVQIFMLNHIPSHPFVGDLVQAGLRIFEDITASKVIRSGLFQCCLSFHALSELSPNFLGAYKIVLYLLIMNSGRKGHNNEGRWCD